LRVRPPSALSVRTGVSSPAARAGELLADGGGQVGHLRRVGDTPVEVPGELVGAERRLAQLGDGGRGLRAGQVGEVARRRAPAGGVEDQGQGSHGSPMVPLPCAG
jgi:hypothetical protein